MLLELNMSSKEINDDWDRLSELCVLSDDGFGDVASVNDVIFPETLTCSIKPEKNSDKLFNSNRKNIWESKNPSIEAKVLDSSNHPIEIRKISKNKGQLGFWDTNKDQLVYVHKQNDTYQTKEHVYMPLKNK